MLPRLALPPSPAVLALIALAFVAPGLMAHDPWKTYDLLSIEIVHRMALTGDWLVPHIADTRWFADPPLYYWLGLGSAEALGGVLEFHQAVRLASGACVLVALALAYSAARDFAPRDERRAAATTAPLFIVGAIGLIVHAHEALPDLASMAAACGAFAALPGAPRRPLVMGAAFGAALGAAFLSTGPAVPAGLGIGVLAAHLVCEGWRTRRGAAFLAAAGLLAFAVAASWPLALWLRSPELFSEWWSAAAEAQGAFLGNLRYFLVTTSWFAWPTWPIAGWALWAQRRRWRDARIFAPLAVFMATLAGISLAGPAQGVNALALLPPLALLAASGVVRLRRGAANALDWFGVMTFSFFVALVWLGYVATMTPFLPTIAHNFAKLAPGFVAHFELLPLAAALAVTLVWIYMAFFIQRSPTRGITRWAAGVALLWATFSLLLLPWVDHVKSYRSVAEEIAARIPPGAGCIARDNVGISQIAALSYHAGIITREYDPLAPRACPLLLVQGTIEDDYRVPSPSWVKLADLGRPGDKTERLRLYRLEK